MRSLALRILFVLVGLASLVSRVSAADAEGTAFTNALEQFQGGFFGRSQAAFSNFVARFPQSPRVPQAILYQGRSALGENLYPAAIGLLSTNMAQAGNIGDQFQYWLGQAQLQSGQPQAAALTYSNLNHTFTNSALRLEAATGHAEAHFALKDWPRVIEVIESPNGAFQSMVATRGTNDPNIARGYLMVARAWLKQNEFARADQALSRVSDTAADTRLRWERQFFRCRVEQGLGRLENALAGTSNLVVTAGPDPQFRAASVALQGEVLSLMGRLPDAVNAYEANLGDAVPVERRREAFLRIIEVLMQEDQLTNAILRLEKFVADNPADAATDVAWLAVGELRLKQHQLGVATNTPPGGTNMLNLAISTLNRLVQEFPNSPYLGKAHLSRGWALLEQGKLPESAAAFQAATNKLEHSEDQAVAAFKLGDVLFRLGDLTNAIANYRRVVTAYSNLPRVQEQLVDRALYQMLQAAIGANDVAAANDAMRQIEKEYPASHYADDSLLMYGQAMNDLADTSAAKKVFQAFEKQFPASPLLPEAKLALARSYERDSEWTSAAAQYDEWVRRFPTNANLPLAEFSRAVAVANSGPDTNALPLFTNYVARFMTNQLAARAQYWIGDYYYRRGMLGSGTDAQASYANFAEAERNYQRVFSSIATNWPVTQLTYDAQVKAGRAAYQRQGWDDAIGYFTGTAPGSRKLIDNTNCPVDVAIEATFAYADTFIQRPHTNHIQRYNTAKNILMLIFRDPRIDPSDSQIPRAWGRVADCHYQLAPLRGAGDPEARAQEYSLAYENYRKVISSPVADIAAIAQASVGLGNVRRAQADLVTSPEQKAGLLAEALNHYLDVVYAPDDERGDAVWFRLAALPAGDICENQQRFRQAIEIYRRTAEMIPVLRPAMDRKIEAAREKESLQRR